MKIIDFILKNIEDFLIFIGLLLLVLATFMMNTIAGIYVLGLILILLGVYFTKFPMKGR